MPQEIEHHLLEISNLANLFVTISVAALFVALASPVAQHIT